MRLQRSSVKIGTRENTVNKNNIAGVNTCFKGKNDSLMFFSGATSQLFSNNK